MKNVIHVEQCVRPRGGRAWFLTLECGHHKTVPIQLLRPDRLSTFLGKSIPKKVKCLICEGTKDAH